ncbi:predicted protein [Nematostella vectensis]|uniref:SAP domain-containing protein n=1 Tax=Nematostella vectensis TaxID=45351 RepID=A7RY80_NEMVE|nr:nucleolar and spindle-associated protein 1 [Nematostella vectensis]EDO43653.1 predicted protein [Nematostella vectensis]|eukprot:XP_001635716.1 predicted protein [Nematostella vectensis]
MEMFNADELESFKRAQLQKLCKKYGLKANSKTCELIDNLRHYALENFPRKGAEKENTVSVNGETTTEGKSEIVPSPSEAMNATFIKNSPEVPKSSPKQTKNSDSPSSLKENDTYYKAQVMQQLENKVQETLKSTTFQFQASRIPRFKMQQDEKKTPKGKDWSSVHGQLFKKMDSIDVYLEKKRKRTQSFYQNVKKAKMTLDAAKSSVAEMKKAHHTPSKTRKSLGKPVSKTVTIASQPAGFSFLKSPKPVFNSLTKSRKSVAFYTQDENKVTHNSHARKSLAETPFRFTGNISTTQTSATKAKKFDLKASLAKPLSYTPHTGKLKTPPFVKKGAVVVKRKQTVANKREDIKNVKVTSRADRRKAEMNKRADRRKDTMARRRGLMA